MSNSLYLKILLVETLKKEKKKDLTFVRPGDGEPYF